MKDNYWIRVRNIVTFFVLWVVPGIIVHKITGDSEGYMLLVITWLPAMGISIYLAGD